MARHVGGKHPYGYHYLGEEIRFHLFRAAAACGTMFALAGTISTEGMLGGANVGLIAVAVLCVNNLRDVETDRTHGKHTWMTALGRRNGTVFAIALLFVAVLLLAAYILLLSTPAMPTIAILAVTCAMCAAAAVAIARKKYGEALPLCTFSSTGARRNIRVLRGVCLALQRQCNEMKIVAKRGASIVGNGLFWVCQAVDLQA